MRLCRDERGGVGKLILVTLALIAVFGTAVVETGSIIFTHLSVSDTANAAAADASGVLASTHNPKAAEEAALQSVRQHDLNARLVAFSADAQTGEVWVTVRKEATTLLVQRIGFLKHFAEVSVQVSTGPPPA